MKALRFMVAMFAAMLIGSTVLVSSVSATSIGGCSSSGSGAYQSGETFTGVYYAIQASIDVPGSTEFGPCSPNDNAGINASSVNIGTGYGSAFVEAGIIICNHTDNSAWPSTLCNGGRHWFMEQHGQALWDYNMWDLGAADTSAHQIKIYYNNSTKRYTFVVDALVKGSVDMGFGLVPNQTNAFYFQFETKDADSGLGSNVAGLSSDIGQMKTETPGSTWINHAVGSGCDLIATQHHCVPNGSYGMYAYTTN